MNLPFRSETPTAATKLSPRWRLIAGLVGSVLLFGGGALWGFWPRAVEAPPEPRVPPLQSIEKRLDIWRAQVRERLADPKEQLARGRAALQRDLSAAYREAELAFKAVIVAEPTHVSAIASWAEAFASGRGAWASNGEVEAALEVIGELVAQRPTLARPHRARAALLLALGDASGARGEAETAYRLAGPGEKAEKAASLILWGRTYLSSSPPVALEKFDEALTLEPELLAAHLRRGEALEGSGRYREALEAYARRRELSPEDPAAVRAAARLFLRLGAEAEALERVRAWGAAAPAAPEPKLAEAEIALRLAEDPADAEKVLASLAGQIDSLPDEAWLEYHTLSAAVARRRGQGPRAAEALERAFEWGKRYGPAHFQAMLVALERDDVAAARRHLEACSAYFAEPALIQHYLGRIELAAKDPAAAAKAFERAIELAPARIENHLGAAAARLRKGELDPALVWMKEALGRDPTSLARARSSADEYFERPVAVARLAAQAFAGVQADDARQIAGIYASIAQYHAGQIDSAAAGLERALRKDRIAFPALLYLAQIQLDRRRYPAASDLALRALAVDGQSAVAHLLLGRARDGLKRPADASASYLQASSFDPGLYPAIVALARGAAARGNADEARALLKRASVANPSGSEAKRALYELER